MKKSRGQIPAELPGRTEPYVVESDGVTVWVNTGSALIGRFGRAGIDIHKKEQLQENGTECLYCTHSWATAADWQVFVSKMREMHGVSVPEKHRPIRFVNTEVAE